LNQLFGREFSIQSDSQANGCSIELQFDFNCERTENLVIADAHGRITFETIEKLLPLFDGFIVHAAMDT